SLRSARTVLELLGQPQDAAQQAAEQFRQHNLELFERMYPHRNTREKFIAVARQGRLQLEAQMKQERELLAGQAKGEQD
ncbi:MAG: Kef-type potassium/proton antiporter, family, partial [Polaromonas sp.]|nr:Kef-type potassium/proton antiporter, family [Polaromonas sp.]